jgi:hypothetical protein
LAGAVAASTYVYATFSAEIEEGIVTLEQARDRETFETTRILDRNGDCCGRFLARANERPFPWSAFPPT